MPENFDSKKVKDEYLAHRKLWDKMDFDTQLLRAGEDPFPYTPYSIRPPIFAAKSYVYDNLNQLMQNHYYYSRTENPTLYALDQKLATLHGGEMAVSVASGMSAVHLACSSILQTRIERVSDKKVIALMPQSHPTQISNMIVHTDLYTGTYRLFTKIYPQMGIEVRRVDMRNLENVKKSIDSNTRLIFAETPANPSIDVLDIQGLAELAHKNNSKLIVDNTFATPALQKPFKWGADLVVESMTKYINGHGDCLGGVVIGSESIIRDIRYFWLETIGSVLSPFNAWLILRGIRTLSLRMHQHSSTAMKLARFLEQHPKIRNISYPGLPSHPSYEVAKRQMQDFGGMISFEIDTEQNALKFIDRMKLIKIGVSLGDTTSLLELTPYMTGIDMSRKELDSMRISSSHCRLSVGLESFEDLQSDLEQALNF
jgi:methionine-gamma-lyase